VVLILGADHQRHSTSEPVSCGWRDKLAQFTHRGTAPLKQAATNVDNHISTMQHFQQSAENSGLLTRASTPSSSHIASAGAEVNQCLQREESAL
jgi:hypothetical protein